MTDQEKVKRAQVLKAFRDDMPAMIELAELVALEVFAKYRAYIKAGFTEQQALEICCRKS